jgi:serine/threonine protein kinase
MTSQQPDAVWRIAQRYRVTSQVGAGGMGVVWRAHDELLDVDVALKELRLPDDGEHAGPGHTDRVANAIQEARNAARLRGSPHVVTVHDAVVADDRPWIVMEFVDAPSLVAVVDKNGPLSSREVARLGLVVLDALEYGRERGVLHCDVKPSNILVAPGGRFLITDFGIAGHASDPTVSWDKRIGTPAYTAPERLAGGPATFASDLFSLGATLYYAVAGTGPFHRGTVPETIDAVMRADPPVPSQAGHLWPAISGLLSKKLGGRLSAAGARALLGWAVAVPGPAQPADAGVVTQIPALIPSLESGSPDSARDTAAIRAAEEAQPSPAPAPLPRPARPRPAQPRPAQPGDDRDDDRQANRLSGFTGRRRARARARAGFEWSGWGGLTYTSTTTSGTGMRVGSGGRAVPDVEAGPGPGVDALPVRLARLGGLAAVPAPRPHAPGHGGDRPGWWYWITWRRVLVAVAAGLAVTLAAIAGTAWMFGRGDGRAAVGAVPGRFLGRWHGIVVQGDTGVAVSVALRGGGIGSTVGEVVVDDESPALRCTAGVVLVRAEDPVLTVEVPAEDAVRCGLAHVARLTLQEDGTLGFYIDATHRSQAGSGRLTRS